MRQSLWIIGRPFLQQMNSQFLAALQCFPGSERVRILSNTIRQLYADSAHLLQRRRRLFQHLIGRAEMLQQRGLQQRTDARDQ